MKNMAIALLLCVSVMAYAQKSETKPEAKPKKAQGHEVAPELGSEQVKSEKGMKLHGYIVDQMCAKGMVKKGDPMARAAKHSKECALEEACAASGYGMFYDGGKWVKFDENGDKLAKAMFEHSKKENDFMADVVGEMKGEKLVVTSLVESAMKSDEMGKPADSDGAHDGHK
jgi:hypothetical protein